MNIKKEPDFKSFTIKQLKTLLEDKRSVIGDDFIIVNNIFHSSFFRYPCRIDALIGFLCTGGSIRMRINLDTYEITPGMMIVNTPNNIIQVDEMNEFAAIVIVVSENFIKGININLANTIPLHMVVQKRSYCMLPPQDINIFTQLSNVLENLVLQPESRYRLDAIRGIISALTYQLCDVFTRDMNATKVDKFKTRQRAMYEQFMILLNQHHCQEHSVGFYAEHICVSPKYLSSVIKQISGRTAAEWIDEYIVLEAKNLLRYSSMNIQEIAYHLNFSTQSFFGKYFKHQTGMTPGKYRALK